MSIDDEILLVLLRWKQHCYAETITENDNMAIEKIKDLFKQEKEKTK